MAPAISRDEIDGVMTPLSAAVLLVALARTSAYDVTAPAWGAVPDDGRDDRAAIQAALDAAGERGGTVLFPAGIYDVTKAPSADHCLQLDRGNVRIVGAPGDASVLRVQSGTAPYKSLLRTPGSGAQQALEITRLRFDLNVAGNTGGTFGAAGNEQIAILLGRGAQDVWIHHNVFENGSSTQVIDLQMGTSTPARVWIERNLFRALGHNPSGTRHDQSVIYVAGSEVVVADNVLESTGIGYAAAGPSARTAIETHGSDIVVAGNVIRNWHVGINVSGIDRLGDSRRQVVADNWIEGAELGIRLISHTHGAHTAGYGLDGLTVAGNEIRLAETGTWGSHDPVSCIAFSLNNDMAARGITIANNVCTSPLESVARTSVNQSFGIGSALAAIRIEQLAIRGNTIVNFPMAGIRLSEATLHDVRIVDNLLTNTGSTLDHPPAAFRTPIYVTAPVIDGVEVSRNTVLDTLTHTRIPRAILLGAGSTTSSSGFVATDNVIYVDGDRAGYSGPIAIGNATVRPRL